MAWRSVSMSAARVAGSLAALLALAVAAEPSTMEPVRFEAAFQGKSAVIYLFLRSTGVLWRLHSP